MKTKIFIDFDGTLFDSQALKNDLNAVMISAGLLPEQVQAEYDDWKRVHGHPDPEAMLELNIAKNPEINFEGAVEKTKAIIAGSGQFLFDDVVAFLDNIDTERFEPYIFTLGFEHWQKQKVEACGLNQKFDRNHILYLQGVKKDHLRNYIKPGENFIIIDDSEDFIQAVKAEFSETATIIQMDRYPDPEQTDEDLEAENDGINRVRDLKDFSNIIPPIENGLNKA